MEIAGLSNGEEFMITDVSCGMWQPCRSHLYTFIHVQTFLLSLSLFSCRWRMVHALLRVAAEVTRPFVPHACFLVHSWSYTQPSVASAYSFVHIWSDTKPSVASAYILYTAEATQNHLLLLLVFRSQLKWHTAFFFCTYLYLETQSECYAAVSFVAL